MKILVSNNWYSAFQQQFKRAEHCITVPFRLLKKLQFLQRNITPVLFNAIVSLNKYFSLIIFLEFYWQMSQSGLSLMAWRSSHYIPSPSSLSSSPPPASSSVSSVLSLGSWKCHHFCQAWLAGFLPCPLIRGMLEGIVLQFPEPLPVSVAR